LRTLLTSLPRFVKTAVEVQFLVACVSLFICNRVY